MPRTHRALAPGLTSFGPLDADSALYYDPVLRMGVAWLDGEPDAPASPEAATPGDAGLDEIGLQTLIEAVAGIVAIAANRAREGGDLPALREALDRALGPMPFMARGPNDPREGSAATPPAISDADRTGEHERLRALMRKQAAS